MSELFLKNTKSLQKIRVLKVLRLENKPYYKRIVFRYTHSNSILKYLQINQNVRKMVKKHFELRVTK